MARQPVSKRSSRASITTRRVPWRRIIQLATLSCLAVGQAAAGAQDESATSISGECLQQIGSAQGGEYVLFGIKGATIQGQLKDGSPMLRIPARCVAEQKETPDPEPDPPEMSRDTADSPKISRDAVKDALRELIGELQNRGGLEPEAVAKARSGVEERIDRGSPDEDAAGRLRDESLQEVQSESGDVAVALLGLLTAGCVVAGGGAPCTILPAIFGPFFTLDTRVEDVARAAALAAKVVSGQPLTADDFAFLRSRGSQPWALESLPSIQDGSYRAFVGSLVGEDDPAREKKMFLLDELARLSDERAVTCTDLSRVVDSVRRRDFFLKTNELAFLKRKLFNPARAMSQGAARQLDRCVERILLRR